jgi:crossover junction endodeoxyribonuclease RusA
MRADPLPAEVPPRITVVIPGHPVPAARMTRRGRWVKAQARRYLDYREWVQLCCLRAAGARDILAGPLRIALRFYVEGGSRGDWDNLAKAVTDAANGILWEDDRQIVEARVVIHEVQDPRAERAELEVWPCSRGGRSW